MVYERNECCDCAVPAYPCLGDACSRRHAMVYECDHCHDEVDILYLSPYDGSELCESCVLKDLEKIG